MPVKTFYMCYVEGKRGSERKHDTFDEALAEAKRLARLSDNIGKSAIVLRAETKVQTVEEIPVTVEFYPYKILG